MKDEVWWVGRWGLGGQAGRDGTGSGGGERRLVVVVEGWRGGGVQIVGREEVWLEGGNELNGRLWGVGRLMEMFRITKRGEG